MTMAKIKITLKRSKIGASQRQIRTLTALGLGKINSSSIQTVTPQISGMVRKVEHLVSVEEIK